MLCGNLYYLLSIGFLILIILGLFVSIFRYTKEQNKKMKFTGTGQGLVGAILTFNYDFNSMVDGHNYFNSFECSGDFCGSNNTFNNFKFTTIF
jgi:hypothetical protein